MKLKEGNLKGTKEFTKILRELGRDRRVKRAIIKARREIRRNGKEKAGSFAGFFLLIMAIAFRVLRRKKARAIEELIDILFLLVQVSLLLKENVFDRPEVRAFFSQHYKQISSISQEYVAMLLAKAKEFRPTNIRQ